MLTPIEAEILDAMERILDAVAAGKSVNRLTHRDFVGKLRDVIVKLTNKKYGCETGRHSGPCQCGKG